MSRANEIQLLNVIGNPSRLRIMTALSRKSKLSVYELAKNTWLDRKVLRRHLNILSENGLVRAELGIAKGRTDFIQVYSAELNNPVVVALQTFLNVTRLNRTGVCGLDTRLGVGVGEATCHSGYSPEAVESVSRIRLSPKHSPVRD